MNAQSLQKQSRFEWIQSGKPGEGYVLMAGGHRAGTLQYRHWSDHSAAGETASGRWFFQQEGFWKPRFVVTRGDTGEEVAVFASRWHATEGTLQMSDGRQYEWKLKSLWSGEHIMTDESGRVLFVLTRGLDPFRWRDIFKQQATVKKNPDHGNTKDLALLLLFGWWMILVAEEEAAGAAAVTAAMG